MSKEEKLNVPMVVSEATHKRLTEKLGAREYYNDVIRKLLDFYDSRNKPSLLEKWRKK